MPVLVDTCGWIEWLTDGPFAESYRPYFADAPSLLVPTCLQFELYKWARRERGEAVALEAVALTEQAQVVPLTTAIALHAADLALKHRLPSMLLVEQDFEAGALMSYFTDHQALFRRAATYVDKILKGTKPGEIPVEQPTKFEFYVNLKTAKQIGIAIPPNLLARADRVIR